MNIERTRITGGFWYGRMKNAASRVLWEQLAILRGERPELAHPSPVVENFRIAAGLSRGPYRGRVYSDSELGKWIEAASYSLERFEDPALEKEIDALVDLMIKAQMSDGYLNTYFQVLRPQDRLKHYAFSCELYNMGHLMEASAAYYHATGKRPFLEACAGRQTCCASASDPSPISSTSTMDMPRSSWGCFVFMKPQAAALSGSGPLFCGRARKTTLLFPYRSAFGRQR